VNRKHRLEHRLQPAVFALAGQQVHLQEAVIGALLHLDQVRDLDGCWNLELLLSGSLGLRYSAECGRKKPPKFAAEFAAKRADDAKKDRGTRRDKLVRGRRVRRLLLGNL
jgi:hypothetical protein